MQRVILLLCMPSETFPASALALLLPDDVVMLIGNPQHYQEIRVNGSFEPRQPEAEGSVQGFGAFGI